MNMREAFYCYLLSIYMCSLQRHYESCIIDNLLLQEQPLDVAAVKEEIKDEITTEEHEMCLGR